MSIKFFRAMYLASSNKKGFMSNDIDATYYYCDHFINALNITRMLQNSALTFSEKVTLRECLQVAERKRDYFYKHMNFNLTRALTIINAYRHATPS